MIRINTIIDELLSYWPQADIDLIQKAYIFSAKVHEGQVRLSGEAYLSHPLEVAWILTQMKLDQVTIAAGLLHDTIEDTLATAKIIEEKFGPEILHIVNGVTKISAIHFQNQEERQAENIRKMILAMSDDIRVILVKLADRVHNMRTLGFQTPEKQKSPLPRRPWIFMPLFRPGWACIGSRPNWKTFVFIIWNRRPIRPSKMVWPGNGRKGKGIFERSRT